MELDVKWTLVAEARDYREALELELQMCEGPEYQKRWIDEQKTYTALPAFDEDADVSWLESEGASLAEVAEPATDLTTATG